MDSNLAEIDRIIARFKLESRAGEHGAQRMNEKELDALVRNIRHQSGIDNTARVKPTVATVPHLQPEFLPPSREYELQELLLFDEERFIDNTFRAILQREPDKDGRDYYLRKLRNGEMSKIGILSELRWSPEGLRNGIHVNGLLIRRYLDQLDRTAVLGPAFRWIKGLLNLHTLAGTYQLARRGQALGFRAIDESNAHAAEIRASIQRESKEASESLDMAVQRLEAMNDALVQEGMEARTQLAELAFISRRQDQLLHELQEDIATQAARHKRELAAIQAAHLRELEGMGGALEASVSAFDTRLNEVAGVREALASMSIDLERRLAAVSTELGQIGADALPFFKDRAKRQTQTDLRNEKLGPLYSRFEARFRGSKEDISQRMSSYLDVVTDTIAGGPEAPVLDLGSGRGEWLHLLRNRGLHARGVDLNPEFVRRCNNQGLSVTEMDVLEALRSTETNSIGAVTSMHLIEHMPFDLVVELLDESLRVLKPGGLIILETPNPENIEVASHWFYMDPTHRNPIPPTLLQWVLMDRGFRNVLIRRESELRHFRPPALMDESDNGAEQVNRILAGYRAAPDFAVVGQRP